MTKLILLYLLLMNAVSFLLMLVDKQKARKNLWRIPESTLLWAALLGGSIGSLIGMYTFRHKTRHPRFTIGIPLILMLQIGLALWILSQVHKNGLESPLLWAWPPCGGLFSRQ